MKTVDQLSATAYPETALVQSLSAASVAHVVSRRCALGRLSRCSCDTAHDDAPTESWRWGGCGDNTRYGTRWGTGKRKLMLSKLHLPHENGKRSIYTNLSLFLPQSELNNPVEFYRMAKRFFMGRTGKERRVGGQRRGRQRIHSSSSSTSKTSRTTGRDFKSRVDVHNALVGIKVSKQESFIVLYFRGYRW